MEIVFSLADLQKTAQQILAQKPNKIILFNGEMGVGKTTLIKEICTALGVKETTSSPTFSIVNQYETIENQTIYHFDCYRLKHENEALDLGIEDYLFSNDWCFIEWAEKIENLIPSPFSNININLLADGNRMLKLN
jgi:tRNA threonylcarbamoyladenosine biosynthesis protein TsaE